MEAKHRDYISLPRESIKEDEEMGRSKEATNKVSRGRYGDGEASSPAVQGPQKGAQGIDTQVGRPFQGNWYGR